MLTRQTKTGLVLAFLLGLSDIAILFALIGDSDNAPPAAIAVISVVIGVLTLVAVAMAWRRLTTGLLVAIIAMRVISALGDLGGLGQGAAIATVSAVLLAISVACIYMLAVALRHQAGAPIGGQRTAM